MRFLGSTRGKILAGLALVLALFLVRPGAQRLHARIVRSISLALGRQVDVGSVSLRLLPRPGFELEGFVVHDDPAFGAEPAVQSSDVVASVRVISLFRGRLEISRLSLTEPSLNLVRNGQGRWNLEDLLERAAKMPVAPTAKAPSEPRPAFPYIEADHGRINLKLGQEKKAYSLTEANFALWQESENAWGVRLRAHPMRTDVNLSDSGTLQVDGIWQRAASLHATPLQFAAQWRGAQLGQATKLALGHDEGWRGVVELSAALRGTPQDLGVQAMASIRGFRRYDIAGDRTVDLSAQCSGRYSSTDHLISRINCHAPVGEGEITAQGSIAALSPETDYDLSLAARSLPLQPVADFLRGVRKNVPGKIAAAGKLEASLKLRGRPNSDPVWQGSGEVRSFGLQSAASPTAVAVDSIPLGFASGATTTRSPGKTDGANDGEPRVEIGPFRLALGAATSAVVYGQISRPGYSFKVQGDTEVQRLLEVARTLGLPSPPVGASGGARVNLQIDGGWPESRAALVTGTAQLHTVSARMRGLAEPIEISAANIAVTPSTTEVQKITAVAAGNVWHGRMTLPRPCESARSCLVQFVLHADELKTGSLSDLLNPVPGKQPWYRFLAPPAPAMPFLALAHAAGKFTANSIVLGRLRVERVSADLELDEGRVRLKDVRGEVMGGRHNGQWTADFIASPPIFRGAGTVTKGSLSQLAEAMHDGWITGTANVEYGASTRGRSVEELLTNADAIFQLEASDSLLPHLSLASDDPLRITHFAGQLHLHDKMIKVDEGKLQTPGSIYQVSGTASWQRTLDIKLWREGAPGFSITGTLTEPHVTARPPSETQAALKP